jgi:nucleoid DNA-binding protein
MKRSAKLDIADEIYNKFDQVIPKKTIYAAIQTICRSLSESLLADEKIIINNFIELETYIFPGHNGKNINTGIVEYVEPQKCIKMKVDKEFMKVIRKGFGKLKKKCKKPAKKS